MEDLLQTLKRSPKGLGGLQVLHVNSWALDLLAIASHLQINQNIKLIKSKQADPVSSAHGKAGDDKSDSLQTLGTFNYLLLKK